MKLGIFTDSHYSTAKVTCRNRFNSESLYKIEKAMQYFQAEKCDLVICLGDLIDREKEHAQEVLNLQKVASIFHASSLKVVVVMGNHDAFAFEEDEFYAILGDNCRPQDICIEENHLLFLDACYYKTGIHYKPGDEDWTNTYFPKLDLLENTLSTLTRNIYLFIHQNLDPAICLNHRLFNADKLCTMIEKNGNVRAVYQGHYHPGMKSEYNGIQYITFPAMCENEDAYYIIEK